MGAWGTSLFADDNAGDLREDYRDLIADGLSGAEAIDRLIAAWAPEVNDAYYAATFWLALAVTQWKCGRLEDRVKERALQAIADGSALLPWQGGKEERQRRAVLETLRLQIASPQPPASKIKRRVLCTCSWEPTELVAYRLRSGDRMILRVSDLLTDKGGTYPSCEVLDWQGQDIPDAASLQRLGLRPVPSGDVFFDLFKLADKSQELGEEFSRIEILSMYDRLVKGRFTRLDLKRGEPYAPKPGRARTSGHCVGFDKLDQHLEDRYGFT
jgi:hypothetical protein